MTTCKHCGKEIDNDYVCDKYGDYYCSDCANEELWYCEHCEEYIPIDETQYSVKTAYGNYWNGYNSEYQNWCEDCRDNDTIYCVCCNETVDRDLDYVMLHNGDCVCDNCRDDVGYCDGCGEYYWMEDLTWNEYDEEYYCRDCHSSHCNCDSIMGYHDRPPMVYYLDNNETTTDGTGFKGYGIELEIDRKDYSNHNESVAMLNETLGDHVYYNRDGSLNYGYEIITLPHTREALLSLNWETALAKLVKLGYRSHDLKTAGLHMHISRTVFGDTEEKRTENIAKMILFYNHFWKDILKFSRRTESQANQWATRYESVRTNTDAENIAKSRSYGRYYAVNLCNRDTVEFRLMRGTLNYKTFRATLDLLMTMAVNCDSVTDIENLDQWFKGLEPSTLEYMAQRNCFGHNNETNEPVDTTDNGTIEELPLRVGDRVQFREWDDMVNEYGTDCSGNITCDICFIKGMRHLCGTQATVIRIDEYDGSIYLTDFTTTGTTNWGYSADMVRRV